ISSAMNVGTNDQCQPSSHNRTAPTTTSRTSSNGEAAPANISGNHTHCAASATSAIARAIQMRLRVTIFTLPPSLRDVPSNAQTRGNVSSTRIVDLGLCAVLCNPLDSLLTTPPTLAAIHPGC